MSTQCSKSSRALAGGRLLVGGLAVAVVAGACGSSGHKAVPVPSTTSTTTTIPSSTTSATTTLPELGTSGVRTVLSPVGLNVRAGPSTSAKILGTASEGTVLTVLGHSSLGWFEVRGATVKGWITDSSTLSAPGKFTVYSTSLNQFDALYPTTWTVATSPPSNVIFRMPSSPDTVVVTPAASVAALPKVTAGYHQNRTEQVVVCGVTSQLVTYAGAAGATATTTAAHPVASRPYLAQVNLTLDAQHVLGINAHITSVAQLQTVRNFINSVTFPFPECIK